MTRHDTRTSKIRIARRKGMTSILEASVSVALFAILLVMLMTVLAHMNTWSATSIKATQTEQDIDYFMNMIVGDVKSSVSAEAITGGLQLLNDDELIIYTIEDDSRRSGVLYRNSEFAIDGIVSYLFDTSDDAVVKVLFEFKDGQKIDLAIRR